MSVRSFHSVFMATAVAGAALGCYLVSLRVASERAALEQVETSIALAQRDIRLLQTEIGTRGRLAQLERWNVRVLSLSAPTADQILGDKFQLARLIAPERKPAIDAPVILASAPSAAPPAVIQDQPQPVAPAAPAGVLMHEASVKLADRAAAPPPVARAVPAPLKRAEAEAGKAPKKAGEKPVKPAASAVTAPVRTAKVDPLAPLPGTKATEKASRPDR